MKKRKPVFKKTSFKIRKKGYRKRKKRTRHPWLNGIELGATLLVLLAAFFLIRARIYGVFTASSVHPENVRKLQSDFSGSEILPREEGPCGRPEIRKDYIEPNEYSRSQIGLQKVKGLVIHYVANPGSTAKENRDYFENLKDTHITKASSHFVVGLEGEIIQCIPLDEISYASNQRNKDTVSIECCHPTGDGKFNEDTYESLVSLAAWLCDSYGLDSSDVIRHYDVTGKMCPIYYVKNEDAWDNLRKNIQKHLDNRE